LFNRKKYKFHHVGIPTKLSRDNEKYHPDLKFYHSGYEASEFGIEWMRFEKDCPLPEIVQTLAHVAFQVDDLEQAIRDKELLIEPNSPSDGVKVAFILDQGAPVELIQIDD
jgi:hypothetical protein